MPPRPAIRSAGLLGRGGLCMQASLSLALRPKAPVTRGFVSSTPDLDEARPRSRQPRQRSRSEQSVDLSTSSSNNNKNNENNENNLHMPFLPPESPRYMSIPKALQSELPHRVRKSGHLPVPRDVFQTRSAVRAVKTGKTILKTDAAAWTDHVAPRSLADEQGTAPHSEKEAWRRRMAETRRQSLQQGLQGLRQRQQRRDQRVVQARQARAAAEGGDSSSSSSNTTNRNRHNGLLHEQHRYAALFKPEADDEVLTRSSVREVTVQMTAVIRDPLRHERQAEAAERTAAVAQMKSENRRDNLMQLYHAAGNFIVNEQELQQRVEELFRPDYFKEEGYAYGTVNAENIWDVMGKPPTVQDMMRGMTRTESRLYDSKRTEVDRTTKRQKLVTEALTGGKMPV